ncbi:MAG: Gfo/Idh/MocA family oxidoreductase [archaeon]
MNLQMKKYRAAIIGLGRMGSLTNYINPQLNEIWTHAGAYKNCDRTELVAACDILDEKIEFFERLWGKVNFYKNYKEMLSKEKLDVVSICTWPKRHHEMVLESIKSGVKAIYCEKPISLCLNEADEMIRTAEKNNSILGINFQRRWDSKYIKVRKMLNSGDIGKLQTIVGYSDTALLENSIHMIDILRYFAGDVDSLSAEIDRDFIRIVDGKADPGACINFNFKNGTKGFLKATGKNRFYHGFEVDMQGTEGRIRITNFGRDFELWKYAPSEEYKGYLMHKKMTFPNVKKNEKMVAAVNNLLDAVEGKEECICTGRDGKAALEIIIAAHKSDKEKRNVQLPLPMDEKLIDDITSYSGLNLSGENRSGVDFK